MGDKDLVSKELLRRIAIDIARRLLHLKVDRAEIVETEYRRIEDRRADLVARMEGEDGRFILHVEIQNDNDARMPWRMLRYRNEIGYLHPEADIRQTLIYIGRAPLAMADGIRQDGLEYRYGIVDMHAIDCRTLLAQDKPEALVLAILCDFRGRPARREVVHYILERLRELTGDNSSRFREYVNVLEILSTNRNLQDLIEEEEKMLSEVDRTQLPSYRLGMAQGMQQGKLEGKLEGEAQALHRLLEKRFGPLPAEVGAQVASASASQVEAWFDRAIDAANLADVFDPMAH